MASPTTGREGYTLAAAVRDVFGPDRAWVSCLVVIAGGVAGAACASVLQGAAREAWAWAGPFTCAALGVTIGGLVTLLPRFASLVGLGRKLRERPADLGDDQRPWWPLRLVTAALADTPPLRRTTQDFSDAVATIVPQARGLVGRRLWPACAAAFAAPALGLVGAWQAWGDFIDSGEIEPGRVPTVGGVASMPMIVSILAALLLMLAIVGIDQLVRRLLQGWASAMRPADAESGFVTARLGDGLVSLPPTTGVAATPAEVVPSRVPPVAPPAERPQISADALEGLRDLFKNG